MGALRTLDDIADMLESTGRFRCLRRVPRVKEGDLRSADDGALIGILVDCEATGLDPERATPIEIAMIKFAYNMDGEILHLIDVFEALEEPDDPLADEVSALTGLTMADLKGHRIDVEDLICFMSGANLLVAHNARYDRVLLESWIEGLPLRPWACSYANIAWGKEGVRDRRLSDLLLAHGLYTDGHRAMADCEALLEILSRPLPRSGRTGLAALLEAARRASVVIFAEGAPFATASILKSRQYRWSNGDHGAPRCWMIEIDATAARQEIAFLRSVVYRGTKSRPTMTLVSALQRFRSLSAIARVRVVAPEPQGDGDEVIA